MASKGTIIFFRGGDVIQGFELASSEDAVTGQSLLFVVAESLGASAALISIACSITAARTFTVTIPSASTVSLEEGKYYWEARRINSGSYTVLAYGDLQLKDRVSPWP